MNSLPLRLPSGSDLRQSIEDLAREKNDSGFVLGVVGNLSRAVFQCPGKAAPTILEGNLEIITLNGTLSVDGVHLHLSLSDGDCQVWGGHLELGSIVLKSADLLIGFLGKESQLPVDPKQIKSSYKKVLIYTLPRCPWSSRAIRLLKSLDINFEEKVIEVDSEYDQLKSQTNLSTFPQIFLGSIFLGGYDDLIKIQYSEELDTYKIRNL